MESALLSAHDILLTLNARFSLSLRHLQVAPGELLGVVGPNGSGKSTLLRVLAGLIRPQMGQVLLQGEDLRSLPPREVARRIGYLPQEKAAWEDLTVTDLVQRGLQPLPGLTAEGRRRAVNAALDACGLMGLDGVRLSRLSGGERQRAWLAFVLVRQPRVLLLDEPTTNLDHHHQAEVMGRVQSLCRQGKAAVVVLHDLWLAARYCHRLLVVSSGCPVADGPPQESLNPQLLMAVWGTQPPITVLGDYIIRQA